MKLNIVRHKKVHRCKETWQTEFQVKWKGYEDLSWEPKENLEHAQEIIQDYWSRQKKSIATNTLSSPSSFSIKKLSPNAKVPIRQSEDSAGYDLHSAQELLFPLNQECSSKLI